MNNKINNRSHKNIDGNKIDQIYLLQKNNIDKFKRRTKYELMYEAFYISNLFYEMQNTQNHLKDSCFYIINSEWLLKWKKYVNYDFYTNENNWKNFIKLNMLHFRSEDKLSQNENYLNYINNNTKNKIYNYFDSFFLSDNAKYYPGYINNKILIFDKEQKNTFINKNQVLSNYNYNLLNGVKYKENYIWVTEDIWKYLFCIYGGFEIRRHNLCIKNIDKNSKNEIILEPKLKTINLILFHYNKNYNYKIDPPKYFFISRSLTIRQMKEKIKDIFPYLKKFDISNYNLWVLNESITKDDFYKLIWDNRASQGLFFPGTSLDIFNENTKIAALDEKILKDKCNMVLELPYVYSFNTKCYFFKKPIFNDYNNELKLLCIEINNNTIIDYNKPFYDHLEININNNDFIINIKLFLIKDFFWNKYKLNKINQFNIPDMHKYLERIIKNFNDNNIKNLFNKEINELKKNMDLIFDKNYLANNIENLYLNEFEDNKIIDNNNNNENNYNYYDNKNEENKKDIKLLNNKRIRDNNNNNNSVLTEDENENENEIDNISWYSCGYCKKNLDKNNYIVCSFCLKKKYCNNECRNKDIKEHLKQCGK